MNHKEADITRTSLPSFRIYQLGSEKAVEFAADELKKYLQRILGKDTSVVLEKKENFNQAVKDVIWVGTSEKFHSDLGLEVQNPELDDAIAIEVEDGSGIISGVNPRSVLLGVYRFLTEIGCRWVRPGLDGEILPSRESPDFTVQIKERASHRHRGICIEGAVSLENVRQIIDWAPKVGFNAYFIQFREAYTFFERWYTHRHNPFKQPEPFSVEKAREYTRELEEEIKKRGLLYHAVGHGWTCEPLGIPGLSWEPGDYHVPPQYVGYLAEVNGKRALWEGIPLNTNLCYSQPEVRKLIVNEVVAYLQEHPEVDFLHLWLADESNNNCECDDCQRALPSDFYLQILNELDEALTREKLNNKIVFLVYFDLLWPPKETRLKNEERFVMMFAPITRTYQHPYPATMPALPLPPYNRNHLQFPTTVEGNLAFLREWQNIFSGDSFTFEYYLMWEHYTDPGYYKIARLISEDIKSLKSLGLNGLVTCQVQRAFFPTGLPFYLMGKLLWNDRLIFEEVAEDYFLSAFGYEGKKCYEYLKNLSRLFTPLFQEENLEEKEIYEYGEKIEKLIKEFHPVIEKNARGDCITRAQSWQYLEYHAELCSQLAKILIEKQKGDKEKGRERWEELKTFLQKEEDQMQPVFDLFEYIETMERKILPR
ncbi:MAG TPA: DUF4838 domain-containing protein [Candidatus Atribacteria bacterium]|nr:DUF4838 domain-containing protein [Candidatus Atribacteria bacterium]